MSELTKNYLMKDPVEKKTKGFTQKTIELIKKGKKMISLNDIKDISSEFDNLAKKSGAKYVIRARNEYRDNITVRDMNGRFYDEADDYYKANGYEKSKFDKFNIMQVVLIK